MPSPPCSCIVPAKHYGWVVVLMAGLACICSFPGNTFGIAFFVPSLQRELNLTHIEISMVWGGGVFVVATILPFVGRMVDWQGPWRTIMVTTPALALACLLMSYVNSWWTLLALIAACRFFGIGLIYVASVRAANHWFVKKRGRVSVAIIVLFYLMMALPSVVHRFITEYGWRTTYRILAGFVLGGLCLVLLFIRDGPRHYNLLPDGDGPIRTNTTQEEQNKRERTVQEPRQHEEEKERRKEQCTDVQQKPRHSTDVEMHVIAALDRVDVGDVLDVPEKSYGIKESIRTSIFWILGINIFVVELYWCAVQFNVLYLFGELSTRAKLRDSDVVIVMVILSIASGCSSICAGATIECVRKRRQKYNVPHNRGLLVLVALQMMLTAISSILVCHVRDLSTAIVWSLLFSAMIGIQDVVMLVAFAEIFGNKKIGSIMGVVTSIMTLATTLGPFLGAHVMTNDTLEYLFYPVAIVAIVLVVMCFIVKDPTI